MNDNDIIKANTLIEKLQDAYDSYYDKSRGMPYDIDSTLKESRFMMKLLLAEIERLQNELSVVKLKNSDLQSTYQALKIDLESMRSAANSYKINYEESFAEIEKLNVELVGMRGACESYKMHYDNAQAEIKRLQKIIVGFIDEVGTWSNKYDVDISNIHKLPLLAKEDLNIRNKIKSEAIKEFAERLKKKYKKHFNESYKLIYDSIDNLVKEMEGEK